MLNLEDRKFRPKRQPLKCNGEYQDELWSEVMCIQFWLRWMNIRTTTPSNGYFHRLLHPAIQRRATVEVARIHQGRVGIGENVSQA